MGQRTHRAKALWERVEKAVIGLLEDLDAATLEQEWAKEAEAELLTKLDMTKVKWDEALDDVEGVILAKTDFEQALEETTMRATSLRLLKLDDEASIWWQSDQEEVSKLSSELGAKRTEAATLRSQVSSLGVKEAEISERAKDDAYGQAFGPILGEHQALIISEYLYSDAHWKREEALSEVAALYPELDLSSLYQSS
ncbi:hypothetical protein ACLOJK_026568 [Asimina triloba]